MFLSILIEAFHLVSQLQTSDVVGDAASAVFVGD